MRKFDCGSSFDTRWNCQLRSLPNARHIKTIINSIVKLFIFTHNREAALGVRKPPLIVHYSLEIDWKDTVESEERTQSDMKFTLWHFLCFSLRVEIIEEKKELFSIIHVTTEGLTFQIHTSQDSKSLCNECLKRRNFSCHAFKNFQTMDQMLSNNPFMFEVFFLVIILMWEKNSNSLIHNKRNFNIF